MFQGTANGEDVESRLNLPDTPRLIVLGTFMFHIKLPTALSPPKKNTVKELVMSQMKGTSFPIIMQD